MSHSVDEIIAYFDKAIPTSLSEPWDNDGLMIDAGININKAVCALDATSNALKYAKEIGAGLILTHHPLIFDKLSRITSHDSTGKRIVFALKNGISVMSFHTRLDALEGGVNDMLLKSLELAASGSFAEGLGRTAELPESMTKNEFLAFLKSKLKTENVSSYCVNERIKKIAILGGSGPSFIKDAAESGADTYLTGEVNHSGIIEALEYGINLFTATHYVTEAVVLPKLKELLHEGFPDIQCELFYEYQNF